MPADPKFELKRRMIVTKDKGFIIYPGKLTVADSFRIGCIGALNADDMRAAVAWRPATPCWRWVLPLDHPSNPMFPVARGLSSFVSMIAPSIGIVHAQTAPSEGDLDLNIELHDVRFHLTGVTNCRQADGSVMQAFPNASPRRIPPWPQGALKIRAHRWHSIRSLNRPPNLTT